MKDILNRIICIFKKIPYIAENGDVYGKDNDGEGEVEKEYVRSYFKNGNYVKSHYRKRESK